MHWFSWMLTSMARSQDSQPPSLTIPETDSSDEVDEADGWTLGWKFGMIYLIYLYTIYTYLYLYNIYIYIICHHIYLIDNEMIHHVSRVISMKKHEHLSQHFTTIHVLNCWFQPDPAESASGSAGWYALNPGGWIFRSNNSCTDDTQGWKDANIRKDYPLVIW